MHHMASDGTPL